jgi:tetratricopeptide (TPR) repeat protein
LKEDAEALQELDAWSQGRELLPRLAEAPVGLVNVGELDSALAVARAFTFAAPDSFKGDIAIILAESGKRDEAIAQVGFNLQEFSGSFVTVSKSGEALEALGEIAKAEECYRAAMDLAADESERQEALLRLAGLLEDNGREGELDAFLQPFTPMTSVTYGTQAPLVEADALSAVGRNDPCPCGSGKKYKKCHGA